MGYQNANLVAVWHGDLPGASFKVLIRMALSSRDRDEPPRYHAGAGPLLLALGRREVDERDVSEDARRAREVNAEMLRRAVAELRKRGLVTYAVTPVRGRTPEYWLHLEPSKGQRIGGERANDSVGNPDVRANESVGNPGLCPPKSLAPEMNTPDDLQAEEEETNSSQATTSPTRRAPKIHKPIGVSDHGCIRGWLPNPAGDRGTERCATCNPDIRTA